MQLRVVCHSWREPFSVVIRRFLPLPLRFKSQELPSGWDQTKCKCKHDEHEHGTTKGGNGKGVPGLRYQSSGTSQDRQRSEINVSVGVCIIWDGHSITSSRLFQSHYASIKNGEVLMATECR